MKFFSISMFILLSIIPYYGKSQELCYKIDSMQLVYVRFDMPSSLSFEADDIFNAPEGVKHELSIIDSMCLQSFVSSLFIGGQVKESSDARLVVNLFSSGQKIEIVFFRSFSYKINKSYYRINLKMREWLKNYTPNFL